MNILYDKHTDSAVVTVDEHSFYVSFLLKISGFARNFTSVAVKDNRIIFEFAGCTAVCTVRRIAGSCIELECEWLFTDRCEAAVSCRIGFPEKGKRQLFVPSVLMNRNNRGHGAFPTGGLEEMHSFREDRMPLPGCQVFADTSDLIFTFLDVPEETMPAGVSSFSEDGITYSTLEFPVVERPFSYQGKTKQVPAGKQNGFFDTGSCSAASPFVLRRKQYVCFERTDQKMNSEDTAVFSAYCRVLYRILPGIGGFSGYPARTENLIPWNDWFFAKLQHLHFLTETVSSGRDSDTAYVKMGKGNGEIQNIYEFTGASFLVKSLEAAVIFAGTGDSDLARKIGDFFLQAESPDNPGVFRDNHDLTTGTWGGYLGIAEDAGYGELVNARCNGEAMLQYVLLYEELEKKGIHKPEYMALARRVAHFYMKHQLENGSFGRWWTPDGRPVNTVGTNGAYIVLFLLKLVPYCESAVRSEISSSVKNAARWYMSLIEKADYYGDTLDADAYDKESAAVLLRVCLDLFEYFHDEYYLLCAAKAADFVCTWIWWYDVVFPDRTPLRELQFRTTGMTSVSVAHHHLDFYGIYCAWDFFRLSRHLAGSALRGDYSRQCEFYLQAGRLMLQACRQLVAGPRNGFLGKNAAFTGWQPEQINYTAWDYFDRRDHQNGFYDVCVAWVPVLTLGAFLKIRNDFPEELE